MSYQGFKGKFICSDDQERKYLIKALHVLNNHIGSIATAQLDNRSRNLEAIVQRGCRGSNGKTHILVAPTSRDITQIELTGNYNHGPVIHAGRAVVGIGSNVYVINYTHPRRSDE